MATVTLTGDMLSVEVHGFGKLWSLKSRLEIPIQHVRGAAADPGIVPKHPGWRGPGTYVPGVLTAGTFHQDRERTFWDVHNPAKAVVIELDDEHYRHLVVEVDDPQTTVTAIEEAISERTGD
jgi:hypothetical protein